MYINYVVNKMKEKRKINPRCPLCEKKGIDSAMTLTHLEVKWRCRKCNYTKDDGV